VQKIASDALILLQTFFGILFKQLFCDDTWM